MQLKEDVINDHDVNSIRTLFAYATSIASEDNLHNASIK